MKYAIVEAGGKQYRVVEGKTFLVDLLEASVGDQIVLDKVLLFVDGDHVVVGSPYLQGASITTQVAEQDLGKKIVSSSTNPRFSIGAVPVIAKSTPACWWIQL